MGVLLALLFSYPLVGKGWVLVLDWVHGPRDTIYPSLLGIGATQASAPMAWIAIGIEYLIGGQALSWVAMAVCFPIAVWSSGRLIPGSLTAKTAGGVLYAVNPIVFERFGAGQVYFVLVAALLPLLVNPLVAFSQRNGWRRYLTALGIAGLGALDVHFLWITGVLLIARILWRFNLKSLRWAAGVGSLVVCFSAYLLVPQALGHQVGNAVGAADLASYKTASDATFGLYVNVLGLYGFWRRGPVLPKEYFVLWPVLLAGLLLVCALGVRSAWRSGHRDLVGVLSIAAVMGYFLALGSQGPTASVFDLLYRNLPGFNVMREPQKFVVLVLLAYSVFFGLGVVEIGRGLRSRGALIGITAIAMSLPLVYSATLFGGLDGQLSVSRYPKSWAAADRVMGSGPGQMLFLPWHEYMSFPWTHNQVIANPAPTVFQRTVVSGDNVQVGYLASDSTSARGAYLQTLFSEGSSLTRFGHLVAQLGISYVVLSHNVDYRSYSWLYRQKDLRLEYESRQITVWRNEVAIPQGTRVSTTVSFPSQASFISTAQKKDLLGIAPVVGSGASVGVSRPLPAPLGGVRRRSTVAFSLRSGPVGYAVLPEGFDPGWTAGMGGSIETADGGSAVPVSGATGTISFSPWLDVEGGYLVSIATVVASFGIGWWWDRRERAAKTQGRVASAG